MIRSFLALKRLYSSGTIVIKVPPLADSISQGTLATWDKKVGEFTRRDEAIAQIETDKIGVPINAPKDGEITEVLVSAGETVNVGQEIAKFKPGAGAPTAKAKSEPAVETSKKPEKAIETKAEKPQAVPSISVKASAEKFVVPNNSDANSRLEERVKLSRMRLRISERLKESQNTAASLTTFNEVDMSSLIDLRKRYQEEFVKEHGVKLGFMSPFIKACSKAILEIPSVNARIDGPDLVYHKFVDISVAVATPKGLVTPVIRNAHVQSLGELEQNLAALSVKARENALALEDLSGGTFTISNGGVFGSLMGTPILNAPQAAILGMHSVKERPVVRDGVIVIRPMMYLALTYDHRIIDGREAVTFLVKVRDLLEDPRKFLI